MTHMIVVGRPDSGAQALFQDLLNSGLALATSSQRLGLTPSQINTKLLDSHSNRGVEYSQLSFQEDWNDLFEDFFSVNQDKTNIVWMDPQAVSLLDVWKSVDGRARFLLVYAPPSTAFAASRETNAEAIENSLSDWRAYNSELLSFYNRNRDHCVLINAAQIAGRAEKLNALLAQQTGLPVNISSLKGLSTQAEPFSALCTLIAEQHEDAIALYDEMQATASICDEKLYPLDLVELLKASRKSLDDEELLIQQLHTTQEELEHYYLLSEQNRKELASLAQEMARNAAKLSYLRRPIGAVERVHSHLNYRIGKTILTCSSSIIGWLCLPAALVYQILDFRADRRRAKKLPKLPLDAYVDAKQAKKIQTYLSYRLGAAITTNIGSLSGWLHMPSAIRQALKPKSITKQQAG